MDLQTAFARIDEFAARQLTLDPYPGISLAITDRDGLLHTSAHGFADLAARTPLTPQHMSEFGSIGKSFTAIICLQLQDEGVLDLQAPVTEYLPWFEVQSKHAPITTHHLLAHSAGLIGGTDFTPDARYEVWALRDTEAVAAPGQRFRYSNVGYKALGVMLERLTGRSYADLVRERILAPLGMQDTSPVITHATREQLMVGYGWWYDDRPNGRGAPVTPATWLETNTADGCIASTPADLATYLRMLMNNGASPGGRVLSEAAYTLMTTPMIDVNPERAATSPGGSMSYGYGLFMMKEDDASLLGHGGGMVGYHSGMLADMDSGYGVIVFVNGPGDPHPTTLFALNVLRAASRGEALPELPNVDDPTQVENAADFAGTFHSNVSSLELRAEVDQLHLRHGNDWLPLERSGDDAFLVKHADFALFPLTFARNSDGAVTEVAHGERWWRGPAYDGPTDFLAPDEWQAFTGHYRSHDPWFTNFRVILRKGQLLMAGPGGCEQELIPLGNERFRVGDDPLTSDFMHFEAIIDGRALRANYCGSEFARFFTP